MPNRLIKESICASEKINSLSDFHFRLWAYLITYVDDYGRGDARPAIIKGRCFPLRELVTAKDIDAGLHVLADTGCIILYETDGESYLCFPNWDKHQTVRNKKSKYPAPPSPAGSKNAIENNCIQLHADESKCLRNPIQSVSESVSESVSVSDAREIADDDAREIQNDHDRVLDAAEDAGFKMGNSVRAALIKLYAEHGLQKVLDGIASCVKHGAPNLAYLEACLKDKPKQSKPKVVAQDFQQRDYSGVEDEIMTNLAKEMAEYKAKEAASG